MHDNAQTGAARISYRYRPSGAHIYRLQPLRPTGRARKAVLVNSNEVQDHRQCEAADGSRSGFGALPRKTSFTRLAKEAVRDGCAVLDKAFGKRVLFATGTLPGNTPKAMEALARWSGYLVERLKQWYRDNFPTLRVVWVWEFQKRGALHLHACLGHSDKAVLDRVAKSWHRQWCNLLDKISSLSGVDLYMDAHGHSYSNERHLVRTDVQFVAKSVGRYLSKYLSKTAGQGAQSEFHCPSRWWGIDNWVRRETHKLTVLTVSKPAPYVVIREMFEILTGELAAVADKVFAWGNIYEPRYACVVAFMAEPDAPAG